jgi:PAS domain S-box-containing protein
MPIRPSYDAGDRRVAQLAKLLFACPAVWAFCEVAFTIAPTPESAHAFVAPASAAVVMIGPLSVHVATAMLRNGSGGLASKVGYLYGIAACLVVSSFTTDWVFVGLVATPWGHALSPGPLFPIHFGFVVACTLFTYSVCRRMVRDSMSIDETISGRGITFLILALVLSASLTDAILPIAGIQVPRLATPGFAILAGALLWSSSRPEGYVFASQAIISREILRSIYEGVVFVNPDGRILLANEGMGILTGTRPERLIGRELADLLPRLPLDDLENRLDVETTVQTDSGASVEVAASVSAAQDTRGASLGLVVVLRDLRELNLLRSRLVMSGRLAAVGQLAAGIAHEINNPIAFVRTNLSVLREHWAAIEKEFGPDQASEALREIMADGDEIISECIDGVDRAAGIVRDVREFSHAGDSEREMTEMNELLDRVGRVAAPEMGPGVSIERDYERIPRVSTSPQQLKQVFLNLIVNAIHALEGDGTVHISTRVEDEHVVVRIRDDGCGIPAETRQRIFDPFFTTKPVGKGTGLGLSISYEIVRNHGGELGLETVDAPGTCFFVRLPLRETATTLDAE